MNQEWTQYLTDGLNKVAQEVAEHLPTGWEITISLNADEIDISLYNPDNEYEEVCTDDMDTAQIILASIDTAREKDCLEKAYHLW
jgi:hypothetical protein